MKISLLITLGAAMLLLVGCASTSHEHHHMMMACSKCSCKKMQASAQDAHKCAMCGHADTEHTKASEDSGHAAHQH